MGRKTKEQLLAEMEKGDDVTPTRRQQSTPKKKELLEKLQQYQQAENERSQIQVTGEEVGLLTSGIFMIVEALSKLPFTQVKPERKQGFDSAAANCINFYLPGHLNKWIPLMQLGTYAALMTGEALEIRRQQVAAEKKQTQQVDNDKQQAA